MSDEQQLSFFNEVVEPESLKNEINNIISSVCESQEVDAKYVVCREIKKWLLSMDP